MMKHVQLPFGAALTAMLALGACGQSGGGGNGSAGAMRPGEWETTVQLTDVDLGNLPPELRGDLTRMPVNRTETTRGCWPMSADVVRIENLRLAIPGMAGRGARCQFPELLMEGGTLRGRMSCSGLPGPGTADGTRTMTVAGELDGTYGPNNVQATASGEIRFGTQSGSARVRITSRRLGDCPPPRPYVPSMPPPDMRDMNVAVPAYPDNVASTAPEKPVNGM